MADPITLRANNANPAAVADGSSEEARGTRWGLGFVAPFPMDLVLAGKVYIVGDASENSGYTAQTSFANTTPSFLIDTPANYSLVPLLVSLAQSGTVAGATIQTAIVVDTVGGRYSSGGTLLKTKNALGLGASGTPVSRAYSGATATAGTDANKVHLYQQLLAASVTTGALTNASVLWTPPFPMFYKGPCDLLVYTYAATTAPTWSWSLAFAEVPSSWIS